MRILLPLLLALVLPAPAAAGSVVAARTIRAQEILAAEDLRLDERARPGAFSDPAQVIGLEARRTLYAGRPVTPGDVGPVSVVRPNDLVTLVFRRGTLAIAVEGRALGRAAVGDSLRVMNTMSRTTVTGLVREDGTVEVR